MQTFDSTIVAFLGSLLELSSSSVVESWFLRVVRVSLRFSSIGSPFSTFGVGINIGVILRRPSEVLVSICLSVGFCWYIHK